MKRIPAIYRLIFVLVLLMATMLQASDKVRNLQAYPLQDKIILKWDTVNELNLDRFQIERSTDGKSFYAIAYVDAKKQPSSYEYIDNSVFAKPTASADDERQYVYRLKLLFVDNSSDYTETVEVTPRISGTKHTWGSIKALFK